MSQYPHGKISDDDLGETDMMVTVKDKTIIIAFTKPMDWIGMDRITAEHFARTILERCKEIEKE